PQPLPPLASPVPPPPLQPPLDPAAPIARPLQRVLLYLVAQIHVCRRRLPRTKKTVIPRTAESRHFTHAHHAQPGLGLHFLLDLFVEGAPLFSARSRRCSSTCCKARFKKSISMAC